MCNSLDNRKIVTILFYFNAINILSDYILDRLDFLIVNFVLTLTLNLVLSEFSILIGNFRLFYFTIVFYFDVNVRLWHPLTRFLSLG